MKIFLGQSYHVLALLVLKVRRISFLLDTRWVYSKYATSILSAGRAALGVLGTALFLHTRPAQRYSCAPVDAQRILEEFQLHSLQ